MAEAEKKEATEQTKAGGGSKKLLLIIVAANVVVVGGLAAFFLLRSSSATAGGAVSASDGGAAPAEHGTEAAPTEGSEHGETKSDHGEAKSDHGAAKGDQGKGKSAQSSGGSGDTQDLGPMAQLGSFVVTLNDPARVRYLKADLKVEVSRSEVADELRKREAQLRDLMISYLSSLTFAETQGAEAKDEIRLNIQRRLNDILKNGEVTRVFITEFVTQ